MTKVFLMSPLYLAWQSKGLPEYARRLAEEKGKSLVTDKISSPSPAYIRTKALALLTEGDDVVIDGKNSEGIKLLQSDPALTDTLRSRLHIYNNGRV